MPDQNLLNHREAAHRTLDQLKDKATRETESYNNPPLTNRPMVPDTAEGCEAMCREVMVLLDTHNWEQTIMLLERMTAREL